VRGVRARVGVHGCAIALGSPPARGRVYAGGAATVADRGGSVRQGGSKLLETGHNSMRVRRGRQRLLQE
jgi:hypothetical protein